MVSCGASSILTKETWNRFTPNINSDGRRWNWISLIQLVRLEDLDHANTLHKQGQDGRMKFKHLCGRRNLPKKLEEQQVNAGGSASPSSLASWGREETDASCSTSDEAGSGKQGVHKRDAKKQKTSQKWIFCLWTSCEGSYNQDGRARVLMRMW